VWTRQFLTIALQYPETGFEEVIEADRRGTWAINALIGQVGIGFYGRLVVNSFDVRETKR
jgi:HSP90 family molecular chaperone